MGEGGRSDALDHQIAASVKFGFGANESVIVTGAASGIGRQTALAAVGQGLRVFAWDLNGEGLETLATEAKTLTDGPGGSKPTSSTSPTPPGSSGRWRRAPAPAT